MQGKNSGDWINEVMNSLEGIQPVAADQLLFRKVEGRLKKSTVKVQQNSWMPRVAVAMAIIVALNVFSIVHARNTQSSTNGNDAYQMVSDALALNNDINL